MTIRSGSKGGSTWAPTGGFHHYCNGTIFEFGSSHIKSHDYSEFQGQDTPNFHARKRRGELLPITSWLQFSSRGTTTGHRENVTKSDPCDYDSYPNFWSGYNDWIITRDQLLTIANRYSDYQSTYIQAAASKIYSSGWDSLTFLAELHKTVRMFRGLVKKILNFRSVDDLTNAWLEGRYGWRVLVYDMKDIAEVLSNLDSSRTRFRKYVGSSFTETDRVAIDTATAYETRLGYIETTYDISVRGFVIADISPPSFAFNPITTAWELIPYSFVIDWIVNIGQFLETLSFLVLRSNHYSAGGIQIEAERTLEVQGVHTPSSPWTTDTGQESSCSATLTLRNPREIPTTPQLWNRLDAIKVLDLVALMLQFLRR